MKIMKMIIDGDEYQVIKELRRRWQSCCGGEDHRRIGGCALVLPALQIYKGWQLQGEGGEWCVAHGKSDRSYAVWLPFIYSFWQ